MDANTKEKIKGMKKAEGTLKKGKQFSYIFIKGGLNINDDNKFSSIAGDILKKLATKVIL